MDCQIPLLFGASPTPPSRGLSQRRLALLRGAAAYAEFALLAGTWSSTGIEARLDHKGAGNRDIDSMETGTCKYIRYLKGTVPAEKTIQAVLERYPQASLRYWVTHPIGQLLTDRSLDICDVLALLEFLPRGVVRRLIWDESPELQSAYTYRRIIPDDPSLIEDLAEIGTTEAFLALLGRQRLGRLLGETEEDDLYDFSLMKCFANVIGSDPHLCVAKHVFIATFADYLQWPLESNSDTPSFWQDESNDARYLHELDSTIDLVLKKSVADGISMPPIEKMEILHGLRHLYVAV